MSQNNLITVTIRSHVPPSADVKDFQFGKPFQLGLEYNANLQALLQKLFPENIKDLGFIAVNGKLAARDRSLLEGDVIYIYSLVAGG
ncbi:MAG: hypothetical protein PHT62_09645 [Desulfotomaculaceae bacterium]|nr:hypothetical protein [Desulfotomaculaceae bacterium]